MDSRFRENDVYTKGQACVPAPSRLPDVPAVR
jgi:hypothetical protein